MKGPFRGEVWLANFDPVRGRESSGRRPALVLSVDLFNQGPSGLAVVLPLTSRAKGIPLHVAVSPPEGGLREVSYVKCDDIRSVSRERLLRRWGSIRPPTMAEVEDRVRILLGL